jgi:catechol-2,3-dioxygenase
VLCAGTACVALFQARSGVAPRPANPSDPNEHVAFRVDRSAFAQAQVELAALGVAFDVWDHGVCESLYLHDPEGHQIELACYRGWTPAARGVIEHSRGGGDSG